ncbi:hypothetical protein [Flyfo siphovirus Tbat2_3]|nr:hypothetical protein [Flyfo siphovirus Tbat2_3]
MRNGTKKFTQDDIDYIHRVAGKVPAPVMATAMGRTTGALQVLCSRYGISLRVPLATLRKHWPDYVPRNYRRPHEATQKGI